MRSGMDPGRARRELVRALQAAHAGEGGAIHAYLGHRASLPHGPDRALLRRILIDEIRHRRWIAQQLRALDAAPAPSSERKLRLAGRCIATFCAVGGWFLPMVGAARLEKDNIAEYEVAARLALLAGLAHLVEPLLHLAEVEWDHEHDLRARAVTHPLWRLTPYGPVPPSREGIRVRFREFTARPHAVRRAYSLLLR